AAAIGAASLLIATNAIAQNVPFSTHDWTLSIAGPEPFLIFNEAWADVKMPGGFPVTAAAFPPGIPATVDSRFTYAVGTIEVNQTIAGLFSTQPVTTGGGAFPFALPGNQARQVAMLQFNNGVNFNVTPRYFYGTTNTDPLRATNARGVSVWRTGNAATDRIAICGETYDETLPESQALAGWGFSNAVSSSGFIAVFDGDGILQWTHHFFDPANPGTASCAITDISIRVDGEGNDIVTYCGISTHGAPAGGELAPLNEYPAVGACNGGATPLPAGQWDGIVGRVVFPFPGTAVSGRLFHANVGGPGQDGLFGLAEIDENRFAVAGSSQAPAGQGGFPFSSQCGLLGPYVVGAVLVFDSTGGVLAAPDSEPLGTNGLGINTVARDVHIGRNGWGAGLN
ncbi:MAG: hypothetical protein Q8M65_06055, partial [Rhodoglobus sp.]|nr:hypothetical protein [Rhodoglobus sp.]